jgi:inorganic pyrophosphatase
MANIDHQPSKVQLNLLHVLPPYVDKNQGIVNAIIEVNRGSLYKYELITESGQLKLDRVGYSSLSYPFTYGAIPQTLDLDNDPLDVLIVGVVEPLAPGCLVGARVLGMMKMNDGGEVDDKIIAVLADDKRMDHLRELEDLGEYFKIEAQYYWEHYKDLKKPGSVKTGGFGGKEEAFKVIDECADRYRRDYLPKVK